MKFAHVCERKDVTDKWIIEKIIEDIDRLTHTEVILEKVLENQRYKRSCKMLKRQRVHPTILQTSLAYDPQTNDAAELIALRCARNLKKKKKQQP